MKGRPRGPEDDRESGQFSERKNLDSFDVPAPLPVSEPQASAMLGVPVSPDQPSPGGEAPADFED